MTQLAPARKPSLGIATAPSQVAYGDVLRVWREADSLPQIEHAWLYDHLGLLVTSNRFRPPAMLAKIAAGVDVISGGRLEFGVSAGSNLTVPTAYREYEANGLPFYDAAHAVGSLADACTIIRRLWTETEPFDFHGNYHQLTGAFSNPKPIQQPHPPIIIGGRSTPTLRVVAQHADRWNMPGGNIDNAIARSAALDRLCEHRWTQGWSPPRTARRSPLPAQTCTGGATRPARPGLPPGLSLSGVEGAGNEGISGGSRCQEVNVWGPSVLGYPQSAGTFKVTVTVKTVDSVPNLVAARTFRMVISASQVSIGSSSAALWGKYLPVKLTCEHTRSGVYEAAPGRPCAGSATVTTERAAVLATASYSVANGKSAVIRLVLTASGSEALVNAKVHPVKEKLTVTLLGRPGQTAMILIS